MKMKDMLTETRLRQLEKAVTEITSQALNSKFHNGEIFKLIEVSEPAQFEQGHIDSAQNVTLGYLQPYAEKKFKKYQQIVLYTSAATSNASIASARKLAHAGFSNVQALKGGKEGWEKANLPLKGERPPEGNDND